MGQTKVSEIRQIQSEDRDRLDNFLESNSTTTMFMRSNLRASGIARRPTQACEAVYTGTFRDGELVSVASQTWKGLLLVEGHDAITDAARAAVLAAGIDVIGIAGSLDSVDAVRNGLGLDEHPTNLDTPEYLYTLELENLELPDLLRSGRAACRPPHRDEFDLLCKWRLDYHLWLGGDPDDAGARGIRTGLREAIENDQCRVLQVGGEPVSYTAFTATLPDQVQIGGVWTPPDLRNRGYAQSVVAGHLLDARAAGVERAILFTATDNLAAQRAYESLGFEQTGRYGLVFFETAVTVDTCSQGAQASA
ncbi:MAG: GNAT family N-acetyltransferase [Myxococcota bacterium]